MKKRLLFIKALALIMLSWGVAHADNQDISSPEMPSNGLYAYDENNPPAIFFFPKDKAKWDGNMVTMREWYMLTEIQKEKFLSEYLQELKDEHGISIDVMGMEYLKALNIFSAYSNDKALREPSTKFIDILLSGQGKVSDKEYQSIYDKNNIKH